MDLGFCVACFETPFFGEKMPVRLRNSRKYLRPVSSISNRPKADRIAAMASSNLRRSGVPAQYPAASRSQPSNIRWPTSTICKLDSYSPKSRRTDSRTSEIFSSRDCSGSVGSRSAGPGAIALIEPSVNRVELMVFLTSPAWGTDELWRTRPLRLAP